MGGDPKPLGTAILPRDALDPAFRFQPIDQGRQIGGGGRQPAAGSGLGEGVRIDPMLEQHEQIETRWGKPHTTIDRGELLGEHIRRADERVDHLFRQSFLRDGKAHVVENRCPSDHGPIY